MCKNSREPGLQPMITWPWWLSVQCMFHSGDIHLVRYSFCCTLLL